MGWIPTAPPSLNGTSPSSSFSCLIFNGGTISLTGLRSTLRVIAFTSYPPTSSNDCNLSDNKKSSRISFCMSILRSKLRSSSNSVKPSNLRFKFLMVFTSPSFLDICHLYPRSLRERIHNIMTLYVRIQLLRT